MKPGTVTWVALLFAWAAPTNVVFADTREVADFRVVSYALPSNVELVAAKDPYVLLEGDQDTIDEIITEVNGDTLNIRKDNRWFDWSDEEIFVTIGYTELSAVHMNGSGDAYAQELHADDLRIKISGSAGVEIDRLVSNDVGISISGSGNVNLNDLDADILRTDIAGSGNVDVGGSVVTQTITIAGSGDYKARELRSQEADVDIKGSGDAAVWALASLKVEIMGSGDIEYYGEPHLSKRIMGSGNIKHRGPAP